MADVAAAAPPGRRCGRYDVAVEIAAPRFPGGSTVYIAIARPTTDKDAKASSTRLALSYSPARPTEPTKTIQRPVAIKIIDRSLTQDVDRVSRFIEAARAVTEIHHTNLLEIDEVGRDGEDLYLVMEYVVGETVASVMRRLHSQGERLKPVLAAHIIAEACAGLEAGHAAGIMHGHLTPHDIVLGYHGSVQVLDVGLAQARYELAGERIDGVELEYSSPERCNRETLDRRSDVFSLGTILWELLTGLSPFERPADVDVMRAIRDESVMPPKRIVPGLPKEVSAITLQALARDRGERYQTAQALRTALTDAVTKASKGQSPDAALAALMKRLFPERVEQKRELAQRVERGKATTGLDVQAIDRSTREARPMPVIPPPAPAPPAAPPAPEPVELENRRASASIAPPAQSNAPAEQRDQPSVIIAPSAQAPIPISALVPSSPPPKPTPIEMPEMNEPLVRARGGNRGVVLAVGGIFLLVAIVIGVVISARNGTKPTIRAIASSSAAPVASAPVSVASVEVPAPAPVAISDPTDSDDTVVHVDTIPSQSTIWIDGAKKGASPLDLHLAKGSAPVVVEIRHAGFATLKENVVPDVNQRLKLTLVATGGVVRRPPAPSANPYHKFE